MTENTSDEWRDVRSLVADPHNRRKRTPRNVDMLRESLEVVGAARSIVIDEDDLVLAGNGVAAAAAAAGITSVRVIESSGDELIAVRRRGLTDEQKRALALYDNRTAELAEWDVDQLAADRDAGLDLRPFWTADEEAALLGAKPIAGHTDPDEVPPSRATSIVRGDLFALGSHRLLCGDATDPADVARVVDDRVVDLCFTSPPYNLGKNAQLSAPRQADGSFQADASKYAEYDDALAGSQWLDLLRAFTALALQWSSWVVVDVQMLANNKRALCEYFHVYRDQLADVAIWNKLHAPPAMARNVLNAQYEFLIFLAPTERPSRALPGDFRGTISNVYDGLGQHRNDFADVNAATFPVHLPQWILSTFTTPGARVLDPFSGTGTTLIAAQQSTRACCGIELDPVLCQVVIDRWEAFTGLRADKVST